MNGCTGRLQSELLLDVGSETEFGKPLEKFDEVLRYIFPINHVAKVFFRGQKYEGDFRTPWFPASICIVRLDAGQATELVYDVSSH